MKQKKWSEFTPTQKAALLTLISVELALTASAAVDLAKRPDDQVRGPKLAWTAGLFIQPVGPIAYLLAGRRPAG